MKMPGIEKTESKAIIYNHASRTFLTQMGRIEDRTKWKFQDGRNNLNSLDGIG